MTLTLRQTLVELRRRKVYRAAIVYAAAAFVVWQVADLAMPYLGLPDSAVTLVLVLTILGFPVVLVLAWAYELKPEDAAPEAAGGVRSEPTAAAVVEPGDVADDSTGPADTIAVLPFENMSTESESEYFADGISEELTHALARVQSLRVAARTSAFAFKGQRLDVREIGARLRVSHVVEGSVRRSGDRLRVTAQLIDTREGYHVWSDRFEREMDDVFAIQDEIVAAVVTSLLPRFERQRSEAERTESPVLARTDDLDAYDLFLRGRHELVQFDGEAVGQAVHLLEKAIELDPAFAPAHAGLAEALTLQSIGFSQGRSGEVLPRAREAADRALSLDPDLPAAHVARALSLMYHDWAYREARIELERALALSPSFVDAHRWFEFYWTYVEHDYEQALASLERARRLDPLDGRIPVREATVHYLFGRFAQAEEIYLAIREDDPESVMAALGLMDTFVRQDRAEEALGIARSMPMGEQVPDTLLGVTGLTFAVCGEAEQARSILAVLDERRAAGHRSPFWRAILHIALGEMDDAFSALDEALDERDGNLLYLSVIPRVDPFQEDPRYGAILRRMGLGHLIG